MGRRPVYAPDEKELIVSRRKPDKLIAEQLGITPAAVARLRYDWRTGRARGSDAATLDSDEL